VTTKPAALPTSIDIGPFRYTITIDELTRQRAQETDGCKVLGQTDHDKLEMILDASQPIGLLRETLLHETLHLVTEISGVRYDQGGDKEERLIRRLSPILLEVMRRNPDVVAYLMADA
jgi:hypothetical protein